MTRIKSILWLFLFIAMLACNDRDKTSENTEVENSKLEDTSCHASVMIAATEYDELDNVQHLLEKGCDANGTIVDGGNTFLSPLAWAVYNDNFEIARLLLEYGADPNLDLDKRPTAFYSSVSNDVSLELFSMILSYGGDVNTKNRNGLAILQRAIRESKYDKKGGIEKVKLLVENGATLNPVDSLNEGGSPLLAAIGQPEIMRYLIAEGADVNVRDAEEVEDCMTCMTDSISLLHHAINSLAFEDEQSDWETLEILFEHGIDVNVEANRGITPLFLAVDESNIKLVDYLIERGAVFQNEHDSALHHAVLFSNVPMVEHLLAKGARVDISDEFGTSLLFECYGCCGDGFGESIKEEERVKVIELLLNNGANPNVKVEVRYDEPKETFLEQFETPRESRMEVYEMLVRRGLVSKK